MNEADAVIALLREYDQSVATAESLTGGLVCASLTAVAGASAVVLGGITAYTVQVKESALGVHPQVVQRVGAVSAECAEAMATGGTDLFGSDWCVSTTGVAGPDPSEGKPVGRVHLAVAGREHGVRHQALHLHGSRDQIRQQTVSAALGLLRDRLDTCLSHARGTVDVRSTTRPDSAGRPE